MAIRTSTDPTGSKTESPGSDAGAFPFKTCFELLQIWMLQVCDFSQLRFNRF